MNFEMNGGSSLKVYQNLVASDQITSDNEEMKVHDPATAMSDDEFDIHQNYHHAIDCVLQCEHSIKSLQEQLTRKDARIASLEEKLVQMSLELASAKALEDEHQLFRRRVSDSISNNSSEHSHPPQQTTMDEDQGPRLIVDIAPTRDSNSENDSSRVEPRCRPSFSQSWSAPRNSSKEVTPIYHVPSAPQETNAVGSLSRVGPKCRPSLSHSWSVPPSSSEVAAPIIHNVSSVPQAVNAVAAQWFGLSHLKRRNWGVNDDSTLGSSLDDSSKENRSSSGARFGARCESSPATNGTRPTALDENHPTRRGRRNSSEEISNQPKNNASWRSFLDDESNTSRQLSNIGHFLGLRKNNNAEEINTTTTVMGETHLEVNFGGGQGRNSASSSRSDISGVVFPVTSGDCLVGLGGVFGSSSINGIASANANANEEWPTFR